MWLSVKKKASLFASVVLMHHTSVNIREDQRGNNRLIIDYRSHGMDNISKGVCMHVEGVDMHIA